MQAPATAWLAKLYQTCVKTVAFLVHSNIFIALAAMSVAITTILLGDFPMVPGPPFIVFGVTLFVYSMNRILDLEEDTRNIPIRAAFTRRYGRYCLLAGIGLYLAAIVLAVRRELPYIEFMAVPLLVTFLYSSAGLKRYLGVKNLLVGFAWGLLPLGVAAYFRSLQQFSVWVLAVYFTCMVTIAAIVFDIKDIEGDMAAGIRTLPNVFGLETTLLVTEGINFLVGVCVVILVAVGVLPMEFLVLLAHNLYVGLYIPFARPDRSALFYGFIVDGEHVFLLLMVTGGDLLSIIGV